MFRQPMADLDLIEAAARAAGYEVRRYRVRELEVVHVKVDGQWAQFDSLRWDGDAFRLLADCKLSVRVGEALVFAIACPGGEALTCIEELDGNPAAAVRLAITRAAEALYSYRAAARQEETNV